MCSQDNRTLKSLVQLQSLVIRVWKRRPSVHFLPICLYVIQNIQIICSLFLQNMRYSIKKQFWGLFGGH